MCALLVDSCLPVWFRDSNAEQHVDKPPSPSQRAISVYFERETEEDGRKILTSAVLSSSTTIQQVKLSGRHQGWFKSGDKLVSVYIYDQQIAQQLFLRVLNRQITILIMTCN